VSLSNVFDPRPPRFRLGILCAATVSGWFFSALEKTMTSGFQTAPHRRVVFCDFDGTITGEETFTGMLRRFTPALYQAMLPDMMAGRVTIKEACTRLLSSIPSSRFGEILDYARSRPVRPGLVEFMDFLEAAGVPLVLVSGGLREMALTVLGPLKDRFEAVYALDVDLDGPFLEVRPGFEGEAEWVDKVRVMARYRAEESVLVGDGVTDLNIAREASLVFARDYLKDYLTARKRPFVPWETFHDVVAHLKARWGTSP
jgi:2-hydroxy-3-keto-5-methylthiopentenyl-1-phosphate phosphatase